MLNWHGNRKYLSIRLLHVPTEVHKRLINPEVRKPVPLFEFNAKNMAIRRAKGEYILSTNADIVFHPSIIKFISKKIPGRRCPTAGGNRNLADDCRRFRVCPRGNRHPFRRVHSRWPEKLPLLQQHREIDGGDPKESVMAVGAKTFR